MASPTFNFNNIQITQLVDYFSLGNSNPPFHEINRILRVLQQYSYPGQLLTLNHIDQWFAGQRWLAMQRYNAQMAYIRHAAITERLSQKPISASDHGNFESDKVQINEVQLINRSIPEFTFNNSHVIADKIISKITSSQSNKNPINNDDLLNGKILTECSMAEPESVSLEVDDINSTNSSHSNGQYGQEIENTADVSLSNIHKFTQPEGSFLPESFYEIDFSPPPKPPKSSYDYSSLI